jgi:hypothetical protein
MPLPTTLFVGTDVSQATNRTRFFDGAGVEVGRRYQSANDLPGSRALAAEALVRADAVGAEEIRWALEATGLLWWHLATYLTTSPELVARGSSSGASTPASCRSSGSPTRTSARTTGPTPW